MAVKLLYDPPVVFGIKLIELLILPSLSTDATEPVVLVSVNDTKLDGPPTLPVTVILALNVQPAALIIPVDITLPPLTFPAALTFPAVKILVPVIDPVPNILLPITLPAAVIKVSTIRLPYI